MIATRGVYCGCVRCAGAHPVKLTCFHVTSLIPDQFCSLKFFQNYLATLMFHTMCCKAKCMMFYTVTRTLMTRCNNFNMAENMLLKLYGLLLYPAAVTMEILLWLTAVAMKTRGLKGSKLHQMKKKLYCALFRNTVCTTAYVCKLRAGTLHFQIWSFFNCFRMKNIKHTKLIFLTAC